MRPKISVIVPIYNAELYLEQCIESVLNQTLRDIELLLIDDGSTDNSFLICEKEIIGFNYILIKMWGKA